MHLGLTHHRLVAALRILWWQDHLSWIVRTQTYRCRLGSRKGNGGGRCVRLYYGVYDRTDLRLYILLRASSYRTVYAIRHINPVGHLLSILQVSRQKNQDSEIG